MPCFSILLPLPVNQEPETVLPLAPGTQMERYTILSVLGQGACGIAYLVQDADLLKNILCAGLWANFDKKYKTEKETFDDARPV